MIPRFSCFRPQHDEHIELTDEGEGSSRAAEPVGVTARIVACWSCLRRPEPVVSLPDGDVEAYLRSLETEIPFEEVTYRDLKGVEHTHWVHRKRLPLPREIRGQVSDHLKEILDHQDYRVELDADRVKEKLHSNAEKAKTNIDRGDNSRYAPSFSFRNFPNDGDLWGGALAFTSDYGSLRVAYETEKNIGVATAKGPRSIMEDRHLASYVRMDQNRFPFYAVFDGHGGVKCAQHVKSSFIKTFEKWLNEPSIAFPDETLRLYNAFNLACADVDRIFGHENVGSTAVMCLVVGEELWVANLGDSRAILVTPDSIEQLSEDQRAEMPQHRELIEGRGGKVSSNNRVVHEQINCFIQPARGFGDHLLLGAMAPIPEIARFPLPEKGHLVLACDGVFDVASSRQVGRHVQEALQDKKSLDRIAGEIAVAALQGGSADNISVLVIPLPIN